MGGTDDSRIFAAAVARDAAAFETVYARYASRLAGRLLGRCPDLHLVEDVVQDTFLALWAGCLRFRDGDPEAFLVTVAWRRLVDALRAVAGHRRAVERFGRLRHGDHPSAEEQLLGRGYEYGELGEPFARLPADLRAALEATVLRGLTTREAARALQIPPGTVKTHAMRARRALRDDLIRLRSRRGPRRMTVGLAGSAKDNRPKPTTTHGCLDGHVAGTTAHLRGDPCRPYVNPDHD